MVATALPDGYAQVSPRGSTMVYDDEHLALRERGQRLQVNKPGRRQNLQPLHKLCPQFVGCGVVVEPGRIVRIAGELHRAQSRMTMRRNLLGN